MEGSKTKIEPIEGTGSYENRKVRENLDKALVKLRNIIANLVVGSREHARALHTLHSIESALENIAKNGAPKGKYGVSVEGYPENPQEPYTQYEGIPVDD